MPAAPGPDPADDLEEPPGHGRVSGDEHALAGSHFRAEVLDQYPARWLGDAEIVDQEPGTLGTLPHDTRCTGPVRFSVDPPHVLVEREHSIRGGAAAGDLADVVDGPRERRGQALESLRRLHEDAERHGSRNVLRRRDQDREDREQAAIGSRERHESHVRVGLAVPVPHDLPEALSRACAFEPLAMRQRDRFRVLAGTGESKAESRLRRLQVVGAAHQRSPEHPAERGAETRIEERERHHVARHLDVRAGHGDRAGDLPQDVHEQEQREQREDQRVAQRDRRLGRDADVLRDALVGVVVLPGAELQAIVPAVVQPASNQAFGEPGTPVELQPALDEQVRRGDHDRAQEDQGEHADLHEHAVHVTLLQGIEQGPVPVIAPDREPDLSQGEQDQQQCRPADLAAAFAVPVRAREAQHLAQEALAGTGDRCRAGRGHGTRYGIWQAGAQESPRCRWVGCRRWLGQPSLPVTAGARNHSWGQDVTRPEVWRVLPCRAYTRAGRGHSAFRVDAKSGMSPLPAEDQHCDRG